MASASSTTVLQILTNPIFDAMSLSTRQRSEYLKNGCKECKRRKIKCDEFLRPPPGVPRKLNHQGRALCWQCTRLKKDCEYPMKGEKVARVSRKVLMQEHNSATPTGKTAETDRAGTAMRAAAEPLLRPPANGHMKTDPNMKNELPTAPYYYGPPRYALLIGSLLNTSERLPVLPYVQGTFEYAVPPLNYPFQRRGSSAAHPNTGGAASAPLLVSGGAGPLVNPALVPRQDSQNGSAGPAVAAAGSRSHSVGESVPGSVSGSVSGPSVVVGPDGIHYYDQADLTLLAADLNNLVSDMMYEVNLDPTRIDETHPTPPTPTSEGSLETKSVNFNDWIPRNIGPNYIDVRKPEERLFLQEFYLEFATVILPFSAYDRMQMCYFNPARDVLLKCASKEPFLLAAVLAQGARSAFSKSGIAEDEEAYYMYLLRCLKLLGPALGGASGKNGLALISNIEAVLLTVLLLTSSNAANAKQNWRPHLKGAKDLLLKHTTNRPHARNSRVLIFCKYWFISFEILAGLGLKLGGTVKLDAELDLLLNCQDPYECQVLTDLGLILPNGFNLMGGYHNESIHHLRDLIKLLNRVRLQGKAYIPSDSNEYIRLLGEFQHQRKIEFFNKKCILETSDFPMGSLPTGVLLDPVVVDGKRFVISWMDTSQQLYALAATITILTEFFHLAHDSPQVQDLIRQLTSLLLILALQPEMPLLIKCSIMMIQWPMLVAGLNLMTEKDRFLVMQFFKSADNIGAGSAGHLMNRLERLWRRQATGSAETEDDSVVDVVNY